MRTAAATAAKAPSPPTAKIAEDVFSSELFESTSILGSMAQTFDFPSWSTETPRSTPLSGSGVSLIKSAAGACCGMTFFDTENASAERDAERATAAIVARRVMFYVDTAAAAEEVAGTVAVGVAAGIAVAAAVAEVAAAVSAAVEQRSF